MGRGAGPRCPRWVLQPRAVVVDGQWPLMASLLHPGHQGASRSTLLQGEVHSQRMMGFLIGNSGVDMIKIHTFDENRQGPGRLLWIPPFAGKLHN